ncbi:hypothetical protein [Serratia fonticola]|uniref:hypothetical protein n=1 Tax=Serratia fonticola TaxID=47917 RepID=UPI002115F3FC|nr:hypothetical protein [Serratia fonticola]
MVINGNRSNTISTCPLPLRIGAIACSKLLNVVVWLETSPIFCSPCAALLVTGMAAMTPLLAAASTKAKITVFIIKSSH